MIIFIRTLLEKVSIFLAIKNPIQLPEWGTLNTNSYGFELIKKDFLQTHFTELALFQLKAKYC